MADGRRSLSIGQEAKGSTTGPKESATKSSPANTESTASGAAPSGRVSRQQGRDGHKGEGPLTGLNTLMNRSPTGCRRIRRCRHDTGAEAATVDGTSSPYRVRCTLTLGNIHREILLWIMVIFMGWRLPWIPMETSRPPFALVAVGLALSLPFHGLPLSPRS